MKTLTAYNEDVQKFVAPPNKKYKESRLATLLETIYDAAVQSVRKLFTPAIKRVVDEIIYLSSGSGICKIGAEALGERCGYSTELVYKAVSALKKTGGFTVARLADGHAGKYIFVDNAHDNFELIMREVFYLPMSEIESPNNCQETSHGTELDTSLENCSEPTAPSDSSDFIGPIYFSSNISFSLKQVSNNYNNNAPTCMATKELESEELKALQDEIESASVENNSREYLEQYATNDMQLKFYDLITLFDGLYPAQIIDNACTLALRLGSDCTKERYARAKDLIHSIAMQIANGETHFENVVATFTGALQKGENYRSVPQSTSNYETSDRTKEQNIAKQSLNSFAEKLGIQLGRDKEKQLARETMNHFASVLNIRK